MVINNRVVVPALILEKLHDCMFFDDQILTSMFFPTLHDAMLQALEKDKDGGRSWEVRKLLATYHGGFHSSHCDVKKARQLLKMVAGPREVLFFEHAGEHRKICQTFSCTMVCR